MSKYQLEIGPLLDAEGGSKYTNHANDNGGPTKWGITIGTLRSHRGKAVSAADFKNLGKNEAVQIYKKRYWDVNRTSEINSQIVAKILFDQSVNRGQTRGAEILQKSCNELPGANISVDGDIGPETIGRVNSVSSFDLANEMIKEAQDQYVGIVKRKPTQMVFLAGWINRTQELMNALVIASETMFCGTEPIDKPIDKPIVEPVNGPTRNEKFLVFAAGDIGIKEYLGKGQSNPHIEKYHSYAREDNDLTKGLTDDVPFCASAICYWLESVGMSSTNSMLAKSYLNWGVSTIKDPTAGDILVFDRGGWKGHAGILVYWTPRHVWSLGANQRDAVNVTKYSRSKLVDTRRSSLMPALTHELRKKLIQLGEDIKNGNKVELSGSMS